MKKLSFFYLLILVLFVSCTKEGLELQNGAETSAVQLKAANFTPYYWANLEIQNVTPANNNYVNGTGSMTWAGQNGATTYTCLTDCSGLINQLLTQTYGYSSAYFKTWTGVSRPLAKNYYNEITTRDHFTQIKTVGQIVQGDLIAVKYLVADAGNNTGHVMLVASPPVLRVATLPKVSGTSQYEVAVIDCSSSGHGSTDTRYISASAWNDGIGRGIFRLYVNASGSITGYTWSTYTNSVYYGQNERPLAVGRLIP